MVSLPSQYDCVGVVVLFCSLCMIALSEFTAASTTVDTSRFSLTVDSELLLFTVQNTTQGLRVSIDQSLHGKYHHSPQGITFNDVFLPAECNVAPCNAHILVQEQKNETVFDFTLGVPAINSMLLLQFQYNLQSRQFALTQDVVIRNELVNDQCSPTATGFVAGSHMTLCIDLVSKTGNILIVDLLLMAFNIVIDMQFENIAFPIEGISFLDCSSSKLGVKNIFFTIGEQQLAMVEPENFYAYQWTVPYCEGTIHKLELSNGTNIDSSIPYLIYCDTNYVVVDFVDFENPNFVSSHFYNETGYPVVCRNESNSIVSKMAVFIDNLNATISYDGYNITLPGLDIDLWKSSCFGLKEKLFYVYSDANGVVLVDLVARNWSVLECQYQCNFKLLANRYVLLEEVYEANNVTLHLFDVMTLKFLSELNTNYTSGISYLLSLPSRPHYLDLLTILLASIGGGALLIIITLIITLSTIGGIIYWKRNAAVAIPQEQVPNNERTPLVTGMIDTPVCV